MKERDKFGSRLGFILVSAGCAIGLGNVWKFPYICGQNGGAAFILIYLVFLTILGLPILISEFAVGRGSRLGASKAYEKLEPAGTKWHHFKWFSIFGNYLLMMFYTMVGGWMLFYIYRSASGKLANLSANEVGGAFSDMLASPGIMVGWMILAVLIAFGICALGLQGGMEKIMKVMMSILIVLIVILAIHSLVLPNAMEGVKFYLVPNLDAIKSRGLGTVVFDAMTHAFFTLSVGIGAMEIFGSYQKREHSIPGEAKNIVLLDTFVALMAGLSLFRHVSHMVYSRMRVRPCCLSLYQMYLTTWQAAEYGEPVSSSLCPLRRCLPSLPYLKISYPSIWIWADGAEKKQLCSILCLLSHCLCRRYLDLTCYPVSSRWAQELP